MNHRPANLAAAAMLPHVILRHDGEAVADAERTLADALHSIRAHLGMEVAFISEFVDGRRVFRQVDSQLDPVPIRVGGSDALAESYCQRIIDGRLPELIHDATRLPVALELAATLAIPVGAHLSVPIRFSDGALYGTLCCFSTRPDHTLNERDLGMMHVLADFTGRQLEHDIRLHQEADFLRARIETVLAEGSYGIVYQPIVHVLENRIIGYEALTRFSAEPKRSPDLWFKEAGAVGLQAELEMAVIEKAIEVLPDLPDGAYLSLNLSPATLQRGQLEALLESVGPSRIVLEITEHDAIDDYEQFAAVLAPLRQKGLALAVDDAGAGYASFRHILRLKPDIIKLDVSLTQNIDTDPGRRALAVALIQFAAETGSKIVAEGVETEGELDMLRRLRVNKVQGYLLGRPMPFAQLATRL